MSTLARVPSLFPLLCFFNCNTEYYFFICTHLRVNMTLITTARQPSLASFRKERRGCRVRRLFLLSLSALKLILSSNTVIDERDRGSHSLSSSPFSTWRHNENR
jgi:hypothetical protein